jgi:glutamate dehydrogenase/leucine dehydrogenase
MQAELGAPARASTDGAAALPISIRVEDAAGAPLGFLEIDRIVAGRCCGGVRMRAGLGAEELRRLARVMTLKCAYYGLAAGGAKGGIVAREEDDAAARRARIEAFGRALGPLFATGIYSFGCDLGLAPADLATLRRAAGLAPGGGEEDGAGSAEAAGLTVALAGLAALAARGVEPRGARVAVQGAGAVGLAAIAALEREGVRTVAVATRLGALSRPEGLAAARLREAARRHGDAFVLREEGEAAPARAVLEAPCELFIPCAGSGTVDREAARALAARAVVAGANDPFGPGAEETLFARGVLVVPDFVANGGGVLGSTLACAGAGRADVEAIFRRRVLPRIAATIERACGRREPVAAAARHEAERFLARCARAYGAERPPTLLAERLAPSPSRRRRLLLALERRARGSRRLALAARLLRPAALARLDEVVAAALAERRLEA